MDDDDLLKFVLDHIRERKSASDLVEGLEPVSTSRLQPPFSSPSTIISLSLSLSHREVPRTCLAMEESVEGVVRDGSQPLSISSRLSPSLARASSFDLPFEADFTPFPRRDDLAAFSLLSIRLLTPIPPFLPLLSLFSRGRPSFVRSSFSLPLSLPLCLERPQILEDEATPFAVSIWRAVLFESFASSEGLETREMTIE